MHADGVPSQEILPYALPILKAIQQNRLFGALVAIYGRDKNRFSTQEFENFDEVALSEEFEDKVMKPAYLLRQILWEIRPAQKKTSLREENSNDACEGQGL